MKKTGRFSIDFWVALLLVAATIAVFARAGGFEFLHYDDNLYIGDNHTVQGGLSWNSAVWAFTTLHAANWHPLTWLSLLSDVRLFGPRPGALHLMNVLFHAANVVLLFLLLARMTGARWRSAFVAALFALHPLHVESVAWVSERKDVLSVFFGLLSMGAYVRYADRPGAKRYVWVVLFLVLSLLSKPMLVTMPFLLLLLDFWPLSRISGSLQVSVGTVRDRPRSSLVRLCAEKIPLLLVCAASSAVTVVAQERGNALSSELDLGLGLRLENAAVGYARYLGKTFWPESLSVFYPHPGPSLPAWQVVGSLLLLLVVTTAVLLRLRKSPWLATGWFWFLGTLVPVIGLVQAGAQSIADRYTYFPLIGVFVMVAWEAPELLKGLRVPPRALLASSLLVLVVLSGLTWRQLGFWKDDETLFRHAMSVTKDNCVALASLAEALLRDNRPDDAYGYFKTTLGLCPNDEQSWYNLGVLQRDRGELAEAEHSLREALRLKPSYVMAWTNLGAVYLASGRTPEAIDALLEAARRAPDDASVRFTLGTLYARAGRFAEAIDAYREAVRLKPDYPAAWNNLGIAYKNAGKVREAAEAFRQAAQLRPGDPVGWYNLGILYARTGQPGEAATAFREAVNVGPDHAPSWFQLGLAYAKLGRRGDALEALRTLQSLDAGMAADLERRIRAGR